MQVPTIFVLMSQQPSYLKQLADEVPALVTDNMLPVLVAVKLNLRAPHAVGDVDDACQRPRRSSCQWGYTQINICLQAP